MEYRYETIYDIANPPLMVFLPSFVCACLFAVGLYIFINRYKYPKLSKFRKTESRVFNVYQNVAFIFTLVILASAAILLFARIAERYIEAKSNACKIIEGDVDVVELTKGFKNRPKAHFTLEGISFSSDGQLGYEASDFEKIRRSHVRLCYSENENKILKLEKAITPMVGE